MNTLFYSMANGVVDPVFYPVVPDSFMNRQSDGAIGEPPPPETYRVDELDTPLLTPSDRWSF